MDLSKLMEGGFSVELRKKIWEKITTPLDDVGREKIRKEIATRGLRFPNPEFDENNLRFDIAYLNGIGGVICMLPLEFQADYVDGICKESIDEGDGMMEEDVISTDVTTEQIKEMNATALGNTAYIILHTKNEMAKHKCLDILHRYLNFYLDNLMNLMSAQADVETKN